MELSENALLYIDALARVRSGCASAEHLRLTGAASPQLLGEVEAWRNEYLSAPTPEPSLNRWLDACESAPERHLLVALIRVGRGEPKGDHIQLTAPDGSTCLLTPQAIVGRYRLDFAIQDQEALRVAVEVDGYQFHHATSARTEDTYARRLDLQSLGWNVVSFTATLVTDNPGLCAERAFSMVRRAA